MPSTFFGLNIGVSGLYAYQAALNTTGHNVSNAETPGYTRQKVVQRAGDPMSVNASYGMVGTGVEATEIIQMRDIYYDVKFRNNNTISGEYSAKYHYMTEVETFYNEITLEGFNKTFGSLFTSLQEVAKEPGSEAARTQTSTVAGSLTDYFNELSKQLKSIQEEANFDIKNQIEKVNTISQQIASLNKQINTIELSGQNANDLRDARALLVDQLSNIGSVKIEEHTVGAAEAGVSSYRVTLDGHTLVDNESVKKLNAVAREEKANMNDIDGIYDIKWDDGSDFNLLSPTLGGTLTALVQVRDGNNGENFSGNGVPNSALNDGATPPVQANKQGSTLLEIRSPSITSINKLNIPPSGIITVGSQEYKYSGFTSRRDANGQVTYEFNLEEPLREDADNKPVKTDESINYKGVPFYMAKMNEFVRTFAAEFNAIHNQGVDLDNLPGLDYFTAKNAAGRDYILTENQGVFNSANDSYYLLTSGNFAVNQEVARDPRKLATTTNLGNGVSQTDILDQIIKLKADGGMFKQGTPYSFMQTIVAEVGVDTTKAKNFALSQENIMDSITNQRLSVSGVDKEEEAMDLIKFQHAYDLSAKVVSVMDEILDKLINQMGV